MPGSKEYDEDEVLRISTVIFCRNGFSNTGVRELLDATSFNRRGLYEKLGGKHGLYRAALRHYRKYYIDVGIKMLNAPDAGLDAVRELFRLRLKDDPKLGCFMLNSVGDRREIGEELFADAWDQHRGLEQGLRNSIRNAQHVGDIQPDYDTTILARYCMTVLHGLGQLGKAGTSRLQLTKVADQAIDFLSK